MTVTEARALSSADEADIEAERIAARISPTSPAGRYLVTKLRKM